MKLAPIALLLVIAGGASCFRVAAHGGGGGGGHGGGGGFHGGGGGFHGGGGHWGGSHSRSGGYYGFAHSSLSGTHHYHLGLSNNWGAFYGSNHWNGRYGYWGSWSNPFLNSSWGWGGWGTPLYAAGTGFATFNANNPKGLVVDEEGNLHPNASYKYDDEYLNDYSWTSTERIATVAEVHDEPARYRLGPDADILNGGMVAIGVCPSAYLLVGPKATQLIAAESGIPIVSLNTDPALIWHLNAEMKRQKLGLESAFALRQEDVEDQVVSASSARTDELANLQAAIDLLKAAQSRLGEVPAEAPPPAPPPVPDATELFAGAWATPDGKLVALKRADGQMVFTDGRSWYSDQAKTTISGPDAGKIKGIVASYIKGLISDAPATLDGLKQDKRESTNAISSLNAELARLEADKDELMDDEPDAYIEQKNRYNSEIQHLNERLALINLELGDIPKQITTMKMLQASWK